VLKPVTAGNIAALETIITELTIDLKLRWRGHLLVYRRRVHSRILEHQPQLLHACEAETSIMQALSAELVAPLDRRCVALSGHVLDQRRQSRHLPLAAFEDAVGDRHTRRGLVGNAEKGQRLLAAISRDVADASRINGCGKPNLIGMRVLDA
jgi:creatinine amidohydrolase/Fe(II)-dependent formamide hydrolase-like protein